MNKYIIGGILILIISLIGIYLYQNTNKPSTKTDQQLPSITTPTIPPATSESPSIINTIWQATTISDNPVLDTTTITMQLDQDGRITGSDGCNTFSSKYTLDESTGLTIDPNMISTKIGCQDDIITQADTFTQTLLATTSYTLGDGVLVLNQDQVAGLTFVGQTNSLSKTTWDITSYNNGNDAVIGPIADTSLSITFGDDGTISGNAGCNNYSGQYNLNNQSITLQVQTTTLRECIKPADIMEQERAFITALQTATSWQIISNQLSLRTADDQLAIVGVSTTQ